MTLTWTSNGQPTTSRKTWLLFLNTAMILTQVCKLQHPLSLPPTWTCSFLGWEVLDLLTPGGLCLSTELVFHIPRTQLSAGWTTGPYISPKRSRSVVLAPICCFTNTGNHVNVFCIFSGRAVVEQPNYPTISDSARGQAVALRCALSRSRSLYLSLSLPLTHTHTQF